MSSIPRARKILTDLLPKLHPYHARTVKRALRLMTRETPARRAPRKPNKLTPAQHREIYLYVMEHPRVHLQDIAHRFGVNSGRVSEIINHRR
jgi:hypothetical protein